MQKNIDTALERLARDDVPARLSDIEGAVLDGVAGHRFPQRGELTRVRVMAISGALLMGLAGGLMPTDDVEAQPSLTPIAGASDLAPASLLLGKP